MDEKRSKIGKQNRSAGRRFESKVRENLEEMEWVVNKWMNIVDYKKNKIVPAKRKYNPYSRAFVIGTGFPDFICFKRKENNEFEVIGVEAKKNGYLDKYEKDMCEWFIENNIFSRILIARATRSKKDKRKTEIEYFDYEKKYPDELDKIR